MPERRKMKLYVWNDESTLCDYTHGLIVAVAYSLESALKAVEKEHPCYMRSFDNANPTHVIELPSEPRAFVCHGGG